MFERSSLLFSIAFLISCGARTSLEVEDPCRSTGEERCDGVDNDCDGEIDEGIAPVTCGELGCTATVQCVDGVMPECVPRMPTAEICNLVDDDCDGEVDEGFGFGPLADPILLRSDEFETGECSSCKWAWGTTITPTDDGGFLVLWNIGLSGGAERPNLYGRRLGPRAQPVDDITLLRDDFVLQQIPMQALEPWPNGNFPLDASFRVGSDDVPGFLFATSSGSTEVVVGTPASGPYGIPRTVWSGERFISSWMEEDELRVGVSRADGTFERSIEVDPLERPASISMAVYPGRVGILVSRYRDNPERRDQWFILLDSRGNVLAPARAIEMEYAPWQSILGTDEGWLYLRPNDYDKPSLRQVLSIEGDPIGEPLPFADQRHLDESGLQNTVHVRPGTGEIFFAWQNPVGGQMSLEFLNGRGDILRSWSGPAPTAFPGDPGYFVDPHAVFVDTRVLVTWHGLADDAMSNPVWVQEFGCVP